MKRVGVIGGGQLAWMMGSAAQKLGIELVVQTPHADDPAVAIAHHTVLAAIADAQATAELAKHCDVITFENEFVDLDALSKLAAQGVPFYPQLETLAPLLDKYHQRQYLQDIGLPVPKFAAIAKDSSDPPSPPFSRGELVESPLFQGGFRGISSKFPIVLKARRHGYDGQGTWIIRNEGELHAKLQQLQGRSLLVEEFVPFEKELAIMVARSQTGEIVTYPVVETQQVDQVCRRVFVTEFDASVAQQAEAIAHTLMEKLQVVGIFGIELFLTPEGKVLVNEIAPRTHNSGHFTLDACETSQFEQQLRAVCGLPLGNPSMRCKAAVMVNLLGYESSENSYLNQRQKLAQLPNTFVHWYGKTQSRPGRKLGHVTTLLKDSGDDGRAIAQTIEAIWYPSS
ncbi:5-(carboxyamino)imidazole ribonucleotide synthase [Oscillatoria sp. FACHB-1407]|nr:5-(carboxyamino)imidazole ribonucleotide synthase [Oscillatoria sp. FACHB-1407]